MKPRSASEVADALECYRMKSERQRENCKNKSCHYNNNDPHYGCWCCSNSILHDAVSRLTEQEAVEPILKREGRNKYYNYYVCPCCDEEVVYDQNYCSECGAKFMWEGR